MEVRMHWMRENPSTLEEAVKLAYEGAKKWGK